MWTICIIADVHNHAFARRAEALVKYAPEDLRFETVYYDEQPLESVAWDRFDLIFCLPTNKVFYLRRLFKARGLAPPAPLIASHNSGMGRRYAWLLECLLGADWTIVNNYAAWWNVAAYVRPDLCACSNISNGVDLDRFYPTVPIGERPHRALWISSELKTQDAADVKNYRIVKQLETILRNRDDWEVDFRVVSTTATPLSADEMREWYNTGSYVVCLSSSEGTPNILLEGAACGCVPVMTPVGNAPELIRDGENGVLVRREFVGDAFDALCEARRGRDALSAAILESIQSWDWKHRSKYFYALFRAILEGRGVSPFSYLQCEPDAI